jgi:hypothetical protein
MNDASVLHEKLPDPELIAEVSRLAASERQATSRLVSALAEFDARQLYLGQGCSSMFTYSTRVLHLSEHVAYNRIEAARTARRLPAILMMLADGRIHLSAVRLLAPHLTEANHLDALREALAQDQTSSRRVRRTSSTETRCVVLSSQTADAACLSDSGPRDGRISGRCRFASQYRFGASYSHGVATL